ncbi:ubiquinol-cytochrome C chaperone family protein [Ancylobacter defluvii]|uniref:Ubiquinol-cytochrome c chaperone n=1 Tax=Ancylobacter defluvii TaxID=1282440 RepID=A0A9W6N8L5_9HYPH|nr:ubiquinol-cytochrome C chaperone family protein [Ancylobacter defluvii]MBS7587684.1 ubiquinol-cytochrome C chaperone [Ancylobacter defluvii]GLK82494.1 ubiquinol-cytochrome c chaperone [Ancylobacter defluvii]
MILRFFRRNDGRETIQRLYGAIVAQSRDPAYYTIYGVADTIAGRFEMVLLHAFLLFHRLKDDGEAGKQLGQRVFDAFCKDMDANLREMGVGDLTVPKKMKKVASAFYGRVGVYDTALGTGEAALAEALLRNVYALAPDRQAESVALAVRLRQLVAALAATPFETFARGELPLPAAGAPTFVENTSS